MKNVVIVVDEKKCKEIEKFYSIYAKENKNEYILFFAKKEGLTVSIFDNKKGQQFKALFTGEYALIEAKKWDKNASEVKKEKKTVKKSNSNNYSDDDFYVLSHAIYGESSGQSWDFQVAVGSVILNRVKDSRFPNSISGVIYQSGAFDYGFNGTDGY